MLKRCIPRLLQHLRVTNVDRRNVTEAEQELKDALSSASFVGIDCEFSGVPTRPWRGTIAPQELYEHYKRFAECYMLTQVGIAVFLWNGETKEYQHQVFSVYISPENVARHVPEGSRTGDSSAEPAFLCTPASLQLLARHEFDFRRWLLHGVTQEEGLRLWRLVLRSKVQMVGFHCLLDLLLCMHCMSGGDPLPCTLEGFLRRLHDDHPKVLDLRQVIRGVSASSPGLVEIYRRCYPSFNTGVDAVRLSGTKEHDAGVDAFMTGVCFEHYRKNHRDVVDRVMNSFFIYGVPYTFTASEAPQVLPEADCYSCSVVLSGTGDDRLPLSFERFSPLEVHWLEFRRSVLLVFSTPSDAQRAAKACEDLGWAVMCGTGGGADSPPGAAPKDEAHLVAAEDLQNIMDTAKQEAAKAREAEDAAKQAEDIAMQAVDAAKAEAAANAKQAADAEAELCKLRQLLAEQKEEAEQQKEMLMNAMLGYKSRSEHLRELLDQAKKDEASPLPLRPDAVGPQVPRSSPARETGNVKHSVLSASAQMRGTWKPPPKKRESDPGDTLQELKTRRRKQTTAYTAGASRLETERRQQQQASWHAVAPGLGKPTPRLVFTGGTWSVSNYNGPLNIVLQGNAKCLEVRDCDNICLFVRGSLRSAFFYDCRRIKLMQSTLERVSHTQIGGKRGDVQLSGPEHAHVFMMHVAKLPDQTTVTAATDKYNDDRTTAVARGLPPEIQTCCHTGVFNGLGHAVGVEGRSIVVGSRVRMLDIGRCTDVRVYVLGALSSLSVSHCSGVVFYIGSGVQFPSNLDVEEKDSNCISYQRVDHIVAPASDPISSLLVVK